MTRPLRVLTWHIHGSYMEYLSHVPVEWYLPVLPPNAPARNGYAGRRTEWPANVKEIAAADVPSLDVDVVLFQHRDNWLDDQFWLLSEAQRRGPRIFLEHDPPREHPTDTRHVVDDREVLIVHVTHFNRLMWDCGAVPTRVVEHGVTVPPSARYTGDVAAGITVVNNLGLRGRRLGLDVFLHMRDRVGIPLDLVGMGSAELGGLGEVDLAELPALIGRYRFFFNPIRYTSLGLAVCEAMAVGMPIVGLATTEMVRVIENGVSGFLETDLSALALRMELLLTDAGLAYQLGEGARSVAQERFSIERFALDWLTTLNEVAGEPTADAMALARAMSRLQDQYGVSVA